MDTRTHQSTHPENGIQPCTPYSSFHSWYDRGSTDSVFNNDFSNIHVDVMSHNVGACLNIINILYEINNI